MLKSSGHFSLKMLWTFSQHRVREPERQRVRMCFKIYCGARLGLTPDCLEPIPKPMGRWYTQHDQ